jgi:hypothetical protein
MSGSFFAAMHAHEGHESIAMLGGAAVTWSLAARAQRPVKPLSMLPWRSWALAIN